MSELFRRLLCLLRQRRLDRDLEEEMRFHLEMKAAEVGAEAARRQFGHATLWLEDSRAPWGFAACERIFGDIFLIPDILCNSGGVTVSYFEWVQDENHLFWDEQDVNNRLEKVMLRAFKDVLKIHQDRKVTMRLAANMLGVGRVADACRIRGLYP